MSKVPAFQAPERLVEMVDGSRWVFRFDNRALHVIERDFVGSPTSQETLYALSASHRRRAGAVSFDDFQDLLPHPMDPRYQPLLGLIEEVAKISSSAKSSEGNESQTTQDDAGSEESTTG